jgi:hypothetical protein
MKEQKYLRVLAIVILLFSLLAGCSPQASILTGSDRDAVLAFSEAKTDNLFIEMNTGDFAAFSKDFDRDMLSAVTKDQFDALKKDHDARFSLYLSRQVNSVLKQGDFYVVVYDAKFEKEAAVTVRVVFRIAEPHQISGLWFNK